MSIFNQSQQQQKQHHHSLPMQAQQQRFQQNVPSSNNQYNQSYQLKKSKGANQLVPAQRDYIGELMISEEEPEDLVYISEQDVQTEPQDQTPSQSSNATSSKRHGDDSDNGLQHHQNGTVSSSVDWATKKAQYMKRREQMIAHRLTVLPIEKFDSEQGDDDDAQLKSGEFEADGQYYVTENGRNKNLTEGRSPSFQASQTSQGDREMMYNINGRNDSLKLNSPMGSVTQIDRTNANGMSGEFMNSRRNQITTDEGLVKRAISNHNSQFQSAHALSLKKANLLIGEGNECETNTHTNSNSDSYRMPIKEYMEMCMERACIKNGPLMEKKSLFEGAKTIEMMNQTLAAAGGGGGDGTATVAGGGTVVVAQDESRNNTVVGGHIGETNVMHLTRNTPTKKQQQIKKLSGIKHVRKSGFSKRTGKFVAILNIVLRLVQIKRLFQKNYQLSEMQYELISDNAHSQMCETTEESNNILRHFNFIAMHLNKPLKVLLRLLPKISAMSVMRPESRINLVWMLLQLIIYSIFLSTVSVTLFFRDEVFSHDTIASEADDRLLNVAFVMSITMLDFIKELNCGYYHCGEVVIDRQKIMRRYLQSPRIYFDSLAFLSLLSNLLEVGWASVYLIQLIRMFIFFKLYTIYEVIVKIESHFLFSVSWNNWISLAKLFIMTVFACHCMAILYYIRYLGSERTWLSVSNLLDEPSPTLRYVQSFYNATTLMVAAIQFNPTEPMESLFVTLATIGNTAFFGFIVTAIGTIVENFRRRSMDHRRELAILNQFMVTTDIPKELQIRVRNYLEYHHNQQESMDITEFNEILTKLPLKIKNEVQVVVNSSYISQLPVIAENFSPNFIRKFISKIQEIKYIPGDIILQVTLQLSKPREGVRDDCSLYLILEGKVDIFLRNRSGKEKRNGEDYVIAELTKGMHFGEYAFFSGYERLAGAKASSYCTLAKIKREDFMSSLEYFHEDHQKFKLKQDELILYANYGTIQLSCSICNSKNHLAKNCSTIKIQPFPTTIINIYNRPISQERFTKVLRLSPQRFNPLCNMRPLIACAMAIAESFPQELDAIELQHKIWHQQHPNQLMINIQTHDDREHQMTNEQQHNQQNTNNQLVQQQQQQQQDMPHLQNPDMNNDKQRQIGLSPPASNRAVQFKLNTSIHQPHMVEIDEKVKRSSHKKERGAGAKRFTVIENYSSMHIPAADSAESCSEDSEASDTQNGQRFNEAQSFPEVGGLNASERQARVFRKAQSLRKQDRIELDKSTGNRGAALMHSILANDKMKMSTATQQANNVEQNLVFEIIKNYTQYYPDHNFVNVMKTLISKKIVHSSKIGLWATKVNQISQSRQKKQIKMKLYQQELKEKLAKESQLKANIDQSKNNARKTVSRSNQKIKR